MCLCDSSLFFEAVWAIHHNRPRPPITKITCHLYVFESSFGELTKFIANGIPKLSTEPCKRTLVLIIYSMASLFKYMASKIVHINRHSILYRCEKRQKLINLVSIGLVYGPVPG